MEMREERQGPLAQREGYRATWRSSATGKTGPVRQRPNETFVSPSFLISNYHLHLCETREDVTGTCRRPVMISQAMLHMSVALATC
jgi:hypothetical protein